MVAIVRKLSRRASNETSFLEAAGSSSDAIVRDIVQGLYEGRYIAGQRLVEADLVVTYGVSRSSVREALQRLAAERVVDLNLYRGAQIRLISRAELHDIMSLLEVTIGLAARSAAERLTAGTNQQDFEGALSALLALETCPESFELLRARNRYYRVLVKISGNRELERILPTLHVHLARFQHYTHSPEAIAERYSDYRSIGGEILAGNPRRAELAGRRHIRRIAISLERLPETLFARDDVRSERAQSRDRLT